MTDVRRKPVVIVVRDGWGQNPHEEWNHANAVFLANTPVSDRLSAGYPTVLIKTSGEDVGLPAGVMGNSEVGHQNIGAGRIVDQEVMRITRAIRDGSFFENETLKAAAEHVKKTGGKLHLIGLMSDGRVHSDIEHAFAIAEFAKRQGIPPDRFIVHAITDGRDTPPRSGLQFIQTIEKRLKEIGIGKIGSVIGRFYAMDRDLRWERVEAAYKCLTQGSPIRASTATEAVETYYQNPTDTSRNGDEFIVPTTIDDADASSRITDGDAVIFLNYRGDRTREMTKAFVYTDEEWNNIEGGGFDRGKRIENLFFATMTGYEEGLPVHVIFEKRPKMPNILGEYISKLGLRQFRCAETEKYPHVTFFFNDYRDEPFENQDNFLVPSPRDVATYDKKPEMSAYQVTDEVVKRIESGKYELMVVNYANGDMVGHTGVLEAAIKAVETVDECVGRVVDATIAVGGSLIVTADHGNCEQMIDPISGGPHTAHTTYPVPLILIDPEFRDPLKTDGRLADIAPTALQLMGLRKPTEMTGQSLIQD